MKQIIEWLRHFTNWLAYTGLWIPIPITACAVYVISLLNPHYFMSIQLILFIFLLSHVIPTYIWSMNRIAKSNGLEKFSLFPVNIATNPMYQVSYRMQAMRRKPPADLLYDTPRGLVLGTYGSKYVCVIPGKKGASHLLVVGGSGSGKTSSVLACTELATKINKKNTSLPFTSIMIDVKGELEEKFFSPCDEKLVVFNPRDRSRWGFDFLYDINEDSTEADVLSAMRRIVYNLVPMQQNSTGERFWVDGPRNILLGLFLYGWEYQKCRTLPDLADFALTKNLKALINEVLLDVDEFSVISKFLTPFGGEEAADETISSLAMNVGNALVIAYDSEWYYEDEKMGDRIILSYQFTLIDGNDLVEYVFLPVSSSFRLSAELSLSVIFDDLNIKNVDIRKVRKYAALSGVDAKKGSFTETLYDNYIEAKQHSIHPYKDGKRVKTRRDWSSINDNNN